MSSQSAAVAFLAAISLCGCSTTGSKRELTGAAIGAAAGGAAGLAAGGGAASAGIGAALGAVVGTAATGLIKGPIIKRRQYYRDTQGFCYWVDKNGAARYDKSVKC